ncbi:hypothetical protein HNQ79_006052, partial [Streptomyces candidus]|nr:hypothetical protein [Streptomyces candidus]MBB6439540.1 hypothetical protein [Streptomyces candidus]
DGSFSVLSRSQTDSGSALKDVGKPLRAQPDS